MAKLVTYVRARVEVYLDDSENTMFELRLSDTMSEDSSYVRGIEIDEELNSINQNPVGVVSSNTMTLNIRSIDGLLMPQNKLSPYFGYMNDTAIIKLYLEDDEGEFEFGTWYVSDWYSTVTHSDPFKVTIIACDIFGLISTNSIPNVDITDSTSIKQYLIDVVDGLNSANIEKYKINYDADDIDFGNFNLMQFSNLSTSNISDMFNTLSQSTITNIYMDMRSNKLKTDYCADDNAGESVGDVSDLVNITSASVDSGGLVGYSGIKVYYVQGIVNSSTELVRLSSQSIIQGDNNFNNIDLGSSSVYRLNNIDVSTVDNVFAYIKSTNYNKNSLDLVLNSSDSTTCDIVINGQTVNDNKLYLEKYRNTNGRNLLEITNRILTPDKIEYFANEMLKLMSIEENSISVVGWIDPRFKLSDTIYVDLESSLNISGYYKIVKLKWSLSSSLKCQASLIKTIQ